MIVDTREPTSIRKKFKELFNDKYTEEALPEGDIYFKEEDILIERKEINDFINSYLSGHMQAQLIRMQEYKFPILIISGKFEDLFFKKKQRPITTEQFLGMLAAINLRYKIKIFQVANDNQLITLSNIIYKHISENRTETFIGEAKYVQKDLPYFIKVLSLIDGISVKLAERIQEKYNTLNELDLRILCNEFEVEGIGNKKLENIKKFLNEINGR